jgi:membrane protein DedA with SNARE-associated domain
MYPWQRSPSSSPPQSRQARAKAGRRIAAFSIFLLIIVTVTLTQGSVPDMTRLGYAGAFLASLISSATIILPVPGLAVTFALGATLPSPILVGLAAGLGETVGELTGYLAGYSGQVFVEDRERYERLAAHMRRHGPWVIFLLAAIPNPTFDLAGIAAGALRVPVHIFLLACFPGKVLKTTLVALAGAGLLPVLQDSMSQLLS